MSFSRLLMIPATIYCVLLVGLRCNSVAQTPAVLPENPAVRAITAFIKLDRRNYDTQIRDALKVLNTAKDVLEEAGYEVQTVRISTQPFPEYVAELTDQEMVAFFKQLDKMAERDGFRMAIGPAMYKRTDDDSQAEMLVRVLSETKSLSACLTVADENGVRWKAVQEAAMVVKRLQEIRGGMANFNFAAAALVPPNSPFYPASYQGGEERQFAVGLQSANVVMDAFSKAKRPEDARLLLRDKLARHVKAIEEACIRLEEETRWKFSGIDLSPAPIKNISIAKAIESLTGTDFGTPGTLAGAAIVTDALKAIPTMRKRAGYSGLMIPVMEDDVLALRWSQGKLTLHGLLSYSSVCACGLDTIPCPTDITVEQIGRIIGDTASLAVKHKKPLAVRLMPIPGKAIGDTTEFDDPTISNVTLQLLR